MSAVVAWAAWRLWGLIGAVVRAAAAMGCAEVGFWQRRDADADGGRRPASSVRRAA